MKRKIIYVCLNLIAITLLIIYFGYAYPNTSRFTFGYIFLVATLGVYTFVGIYFRTSNVDEYYLANRSVSSVKNGIASAADWISAASFISLTGQIFNLGFYGYTYLIGWVGGFCLLAFLAAPYLRASGLYTLSEFFAHRYPNHFRRRALATEIQKPFSPRTPMRSTNVSLRLLASTLVVSICFIYLVAQIYGIGLIVSRLTEIDFSISIFIALAGVLVCSFLGGMRAITWTQILQYLIFMSAMLITLLWLSHRYLDTINPINIYPKLLAINQNIEVQQTQNRSEIEVRKEFSEIAVVMQKRLDDLPQSFHTERQHLAYQLKRLHANNANFYEIKAAEIALQQFPRNEIEARLLWQKKLNDARLHANGPQKLTAPSSSPAANQTDKQASKLNIAHQTEGSNSNISFLAFVFCLMMGTASMPHLLSRSYTARSVTMARSSVFWALFFILLFYLSLPALALLIKHIVQLSLIGMPFTQLPDWIFYWSELDPADSLLSLIDINQDGYVQASEIQFSNDIVLLAIPEIAQLPFAISALLAAGALAAALSTADGLLFTIASTCSHDIYFAIFNPDASSRTRVTVSKLVLLMIAMIATFIASLRPGNIVLLVEVAFSLSASVLFPSLALAVLWRRANFYGTICAILTGLFVTIYYFSLTYPEFGGSPNQAWFGVSHSGAGFFGATAGFIVHFFVSHFTPTHKEADDFIDLIRQ